MKLSNDEEAHLKTGINSLGEQNPLVEFMMTMSWVAGTHEKYLLPCMGGVAIPQGLLLATAFSSG